MILSAFVIELLITFGEETMTCIVIYFLNSYYLGLSCAKQLTPIIAFSSHTVLQGRSNPYVTDEEAEAKNG